MHPQIVDDLISICKILQKHKVQYLIIGGFAVGLHGYSRMSIDNAGKVIQKQDFDFWYNPSYKNYFNLIDALEEMGQNVEIFRKEKTPNPHSSFFKFALPNFTIDFLPVVAGLSKFIDSYLRKEIIKIDDIEIGFICFEDLLINKKTTARLKDFEDIQKLNEIKNNNIEL